MYSDANRQPPRFSILLPTHNRADVLRFAIRSALWQTEANFELLIVGDGCTDQTSDLVSSFQDPRIRWFDLPKAPGVGYANRNIGLRQARGSYVAYLAHDDIWFPDHLERLAWLLDKSGAELAYSRSLAVDLQGRMTPYWYNLEVPRHRTGLWRGQSAITMCSVVHTRACLTKYGFWDETILRGADVAMWHRILACGEFQNVAFLGEATSLHFVANWRATNGHRRRMRVVGWLVDGFLDDMLPQALRLSAREGQTQQEVAWLRLSQNPRAAVDEIRRAIVQFQDALLWQGRSVGGLIGLRVGQTTGAAVNWLWDRAQRLSSAELRRVLRSRDVLTRPLDKRSGGRAVR